MFININIQTQNPVNNLFILNCIAHNSIPCLHIIYLSNKLF